MKAATYFLTAAVLTTGIVGIRAYGTLNGDQAAPGGLAPRVGIAANGIAATPPTQIAQAVPGPIKERPPIAKAPPAVDETALRYFAAKGDTKRLQAEIARLKALYPGWTPPENPSAVEQAGDAALDQMWRLYSEGKYAELRKAIADRRDSEAGWTPPSDLLERLGVAEAREQLINASELKQYQTVIRIGSATPSLLTCGEADVLWRVAEAFARTDREERATDAYRYILANCENPSERLATVKKAMPLLSRTGIDTLLALEKNGTDGIGEFATIRDDLARKSVADAGTNPDAVVDPKDIETLERLAEQQKLPSDAILLGWYNLRRHNADAAETWFRRARDTENSVESSEGLALALVEQAKFAEAEAVLHEWHDASDNARSIYLAATSNLLAVDPSVAIGEEVLQRIVRVTVAARDPANAQQLGWYALALNQFDTASRWFATALNWKADDEPSAYGLALTRNRLGDQAGVQEIQRAWQGRSERIARSGEATSPKSRKVLDPQANARAAAGTAAQAALAEAPEQRQARSKPERSARAPASSRQASAGCTHAASAEGLPPQAALDLGWCLMRLDRPLQAAQAFEAALKRGSNQIREDAAYGQSLAYLRAGLTDRAAVAATRAPQRPARSIELQASLLAARATGAFEMGRYVETLLALDHLSQIAPERLDLMALRGHAYLNLGRLGDARKVFEALAATGSREGVRGIAAVNARQQ